MVLRARGLPIPGHGGPGAEPSRVPRRPRPRRAASSRMSCIPETQDMTMLTRREWHTMVVGGVLAGAFRARPRAQPIESRVAGVLIGAQRATTCRGERAIPPSGRCSRCSATSAGTFPPISSTSTRAVTRSRKCGAASSSASGGRRASHRPSFRLATHTTSRSSRGGSCPS